VDEPAAVTGKMVLVFDDVFTGGLTLREVAFKLKASGATCVAGIVLARQPY
jgi:predicted amidophosphoribosyltransferase